MALEQLITIVIAVLIIFFVWGIAKKLFKLLFYAGSAIILLVALTSFFIYQDIKDLRENFSDSTKKVILIDEDEVITGFLLDGGVNFLENQQIDEFNSYLKEEDYNKILGDSYKLMVFDIEVVSGLDVEYIDIGEKTISKEDSVAALRSDDPFTMLKSRNIDEDDLEITREEAQNSAKTKAALFGIILENEILSSKNPLVFFSGFKKNIIAIYPETALFKAVKIIPLAFIKDVSKKILGKTTEKAKTFLIKESE